MTQKQTQPGTGNPNNHPYVFFLMLVISIFFGLFAAQAKAVTLAHSSVRTQFTPSSSFLPSSFLPFSRGELTFLQLATKPALVDVPPFAIRLPMREQSGRTGAFGWIRTSPADSGNSTERLGCSGHQRAAGPHPSPKGSRP